MEKLKFHQSSVCGQIDNCWCNILMMLKFMAVVEELLSFKEAVEGEVLKDLVQDVLTYKEVGTQTEDAGGVEAHTKTVDAGGDPKEVADFSVEISGEAGMNARTVRRCDTKLNKKLKNIEEKKKVREFKRKERNVRSTFASENVPNYKGNLDIETILDDLEEVEIETKLRNKNRKKRSLCNNYGLKYDNLEVQTLCTICMNVVD